jgi:hypothetical protein
VFEWLFVGACVAFAGYTIARSLAEEAAQQREEAAVRAARIAGHREFCLVTRYPVARREGSEFPWCTCAWKTARKG